MPPPPQTVTPAEALDAVEFVAEEALEATAELIDHPERFSYFGIMDAVRLLRAKLCEVRAVVREQRGQGGEPPPF